MSAQEVQRSDAGARDALAAGIRRQNAAEPSCAPGRLTGDRNNAYVRGSEWRSGTIDGVGNAGARTAFALDTMSDSHCQFGARGPSHPGDISIITSRVSMTSLYYNIERTALGAVTAITLCVRSEQTPSSFSSSFFSFSFSSAYLPGLRRASTHGRICRCRSHAQEHPLKQISSDVTQRIKQGNTQRQPVCAHDR